MDWFSIRLNGNGNGNGDGKNKRGKGGKSKRVALGNSVTSWHLELRTSSFGKRLNPDY